MGPQLWHWVPVLTGEPRPPRARPLSPREQSMNRTQTRDWVQRGVVELAPPRPWTNNLVFVQKKDGRTRMCVDCTPVNDVTAPLGWPLPRLQDLRHRLTGASWFSRMDLKDAFFRISIPLEYRDYTSYRCDGRAYRFKRMPFGLTTAPEVFQRMMDHILAEHWQYAFWYIDDVLVWGNTKSELSKRTARVRASLEKHRHTVSDTKSEYDKEALLFAGLWIAGGQIAPNREKVQALLKLPAPRTKADARSALGLASYLRDFIPLASQLTAAMTGAELSETEYEAHWTRFMRHVAHTITQLREWDEEADADLYTDASLTGCSALLIQHGRIIALASRKFTPAETRYSATDREHLGLILAAHKFRIFVQRKGAVTRCHTDHQSLLTRRIHELTPRQARWRLTVANNIPELRHVKGAQNPADFFSRKGCLEGWGPTLTIRRRKFPLDHGM